MADPTKRRANDKGPETATDTVSGPLREPLESTAVLNAFRQAIASMIAFRVGLGRMALPVFWLSG
jgi:hypothetical protein